MINAGIAGLGWWGKTLVEAVSGQSDQIRFVAGATEDVDDETRAFVKQHGIELVKNFDALIASSKVDAVVLATPNSMHVAQVVAAASRGKHAFCEKPLSLTKEGAERAVEATTKAGVTLGLDYNRRLHPEMTKLREQIKSGDLGEILHVESTMTFPNALMLKPGAWRASRDETPCGGLTPLGVHAIDGMIDLCGEIDELYCQSFRRAVPVDADDTTSILFRMKAGMSGYLGTMTATGGGFNFVVYGSKGFVKLEGMTHIAGAPSEERRTQLFGRCTFKPIKGPAEVWEAARMDIVKATLDNFAEAASGSKPFMIPTGEMVHGAAVTEAIVKSAASHQVVKVP